MGTNTDWNNTAYAQLDPTKKDNKLLPCTHGTFCAEFEVELPYRENFSLGSYFHDFVNSLWGAGKMQEMHHLHFALHLSKTCTLHNLI